jgi:hypothetical protein
MYLNDKEDEHDMSYRSTIRSLGTSLFLAIALVSNLAAMPSVSAGRYAQSISQFPTKVTLNPSVQSAVLGGSVTFKVLLSQPTNRPGIALPTGNVTFTLTSSNGGQTSSKVVALQDGTASWTTAPPVGSDTVVASYAGDLNYASAQGQTAVTIEYPGSPDFDFSLPTITVKAGQSFSGNISLQSFNGFSGNVSFTVGQLPQGSKFTLTSPYVTITSESSTSASTGAKTVPFELGTSSTVVTTVSGLLLLGSFSLRRRRQWRKTSSLLVLLSLGTLLLTIGCASNRFVQSDGTPAGTYSIPVTGTSGSLTHTHNLTLVVQKN